MSNNIVVTTVSSRNDKVVSRFQLELYDAREGVTDFFRGSCGEAVIKLRRMPEFSGEGRWNVAYRTVIKDYKDTVISDTGVIQTPGMTNYRFKLFQLWSVKQLAKTIAAVNADLKRKG
jgi:hypothetical protein